MGVVIGEAGIVVVDGRVDGLLLFVDDDGLPEVLACNIVLGYY